MLVGKVCLMVGDPALGPILDDQALGVLEPDLLERLLPGDTLQLLHGHGDQVGDADGSLKASQLNIFPLIFHPIAF